ncbi:hypothetical protein QBC37DRAFT_204413 [Rhypophila decipiens]|uniref:Uncharacterized protein n=1 Tax=Rhypophila decipiens TaxID=261697 RepID=A0AAN6Y3N3_9PEZI|nr:hypothetical protein QBC37DRAFT_204413 [Rhypophila decipiens]
MFSIAHSQSLSSTRINGVPEDVVPLPVLTMMLVAAHRTPWSTANDWYIYLKIPKETTSFISRLASRDGRKDHARFLKMQCFPGIPSRGPLVGHRLKILGEIKPKPRKHEAEYTMGLDVVPPLSVNDFISSIEDGLERWEATHDGTYDLDTREWVIAQLDLFVERGYMIDDERLATAKANILVHWMDWRAINNIPLGTNVLGPLPRGRQRHRDPSVDSSLDQVKSESKIDPSNSWTVRNKPDITVIVNRDQNTFTTWGCSKMNLCLRQIQSIIPPKRQCWMQF